MRRKETGIGGIIALIILFNIFGGLGDLIFGLLGLLFTLIPLGIPAFIIYAVIKSGKESTKRSTRSTSVRRKTTSTSVSHLTSAESRKINTKLRNYFSSNVSLPIINDVSLTTVNGVFESVDKLYLCTGGEKIVQLSEFRSKYRDIYDKIVELLLVFSKQNDDVLAAKVEVPETVQTQEAKKKPAVSQATAYITKINALNDAIPHEEISNSLYQTCDLLKQIDLAVKKKDDDSLSKLYDYYMPILVNILENYRELQDAPIKSPDFKKTETQLIKTIILINEALKTIYSSLHEEDYLNLNADMNTLQSLLQKDGYGEDPFKGVK